MRRTQDRSLEIVSNLPIRGNAHEEGGLGPIGDVIWSGLPTSLKMIKKWWFGSNALEELSYMIYAGLLPNLERLAFIVKLNSAINIAGWTNCVLNPFIKVLCLSPNSTPPLNFSRLLHQGGFPIIKCLYLDLLKKKALATFIGILWLEGVKGAHTLRGMLVGKETSEKTLLQLRALLSAAEVRRARK